MADNKNFIIRHNGQPKTVAPVSRLGVLFCLIAAVILFSCEKIPDHCGRGVTYDPKFQFCFAGSAHNLCNGSEFNPLTQECIDEKTVGARCVNGGPVTLGTPCNGYTLSTASAPADGGEITRTPDNTNYPAGTDVVLFANAATGYTFIGWAGASASTSLTETVTMNSNKPLIALFQPNTPILVTTEYPPNGGNITRVENGNQVTVTAVANDDHTFEKWAGAVESTEPTVTVTIDEGKTLVAIFTPARHALTVNVNPVAGGTVFVDNTAMTGISYHDAGARVEVLAQAAEGYVFTGWSGSFSSIPADMFGINLDRDMSITANFAPTGTPPGPCTGVSIAIPGSNCCLLQPTFPGCVGGSTVVEAYCYWEANEYNQYTAACSPIGHIGCEDGVTCTPLQCRDNWGIVMRNCDDPGSIISAKATDYFNTGITYSTFSDARDGQVYHAVTIGTQTWMAENLNFSGSGSVGRCYQNVSANCETYGRLYDWATVMNLPSSCNNDICAGQIESDICPAGWRVPSDAEWNTLERFADPYYTSILENSVGKKLKTMAGWAGGGTGTDDFGFSALPGGFNEGGLNFESIGSAGRWWSSTERSIDQVQRRAMISGGGGWDSDPVYSNWSPKVSLFSVRCIRN